MNVMAKPLPPTNTANLLTINCFNELLEFDNRLKNDIYQENNGIKYYYEDLCETFSPHDVIGSDDTDEDLDEATTIGKSASRPCRRPAIPLDFVYDSESDSFQLPFKTDEELVKKIQQGKTERALFRNENGVIRISDLFGTIKPENFYQNELTGENNLSEARGAIFVLYLTVLTGTG